MKGFTLRSSGGEGGDAPGPAAKRPSGNARRAFPISYEISTHEKQFIEHFGPNGLRLNPRLVPEGLRTYVICFTNRCGSTLLSELISTNTGLGKAREYLNAPGVIRVSTRQNFRTLQQYLRWLVRKRASAEGILGIKLSYRQLFFLARTRLMPAFFGEVRFIHMQRLDVLQQAVSHVIAAQTAAWTSKHTGRLDALDVVFNENQIVNVMDSIHEANAKLRCFFDLYGIRAVSVTYEELVRDLQSTGDRVIRELDFPGLESRPVSPAAITLRKQSTQLNEAFVRRMRERFDTFTSRD